MQFPAIPSRAERGQASGMLFSQSIPLTLTWSRQMRDGFSSLSSNALGQNIYVPRPYCHHISCLSLSFYIPCRWL